VVLFIICNERVCFFYIKSLKNLFLKFLNLSFTPYVDLKKLIQRVFTILWILVSLVIIIIFVGMFTTAMTVYAINGQSLSEKVIGFNKYSVDRPWLDLENANSVGN
jgi:hypothetical protein